MNPTRTHAAFLLIGAALAACGGNPQEPSGSSGTTTGTGGATSSSSTGGATSTTGTGGATSSSSTGTGGTGGGGGTPGWVKPSCAAVQGTGAVTFTFDDGATLTPTAQQLVNIGYTFGLVALDMPNTLVAEHKGFILRSQDAGCTWTTLGPVDKSPLTLAAATGGRAYGFPDNNDGLFRIEANGTIFKLKSPAPNVVGVAADPKNSAHVRVAGADASLWDSTDAGATWAPIGVIPPVSFSPPLVYRFAFDPKDIDHLLVGLATDGAFESDDGGATWTKATGFSQKNANVFSIVISPVEGSVVWAQGIDLEHTNDPVFEGRTIWRSTDGGKTFTPVVTQTASITLRNQELLAAHPQRSDVLYFAFGTYFQNYGTDIYRYDNSTQAVTTTHNQYNDVSAFAFSPTDPPVMYLGLTADVPN